MNTPTTIVVGAGIVGVATALWLQRAGVAVTLIDRLPPGEATSHGNAGLLAASSSVPLTIPGLISKAPRMLLDRNAPLFLRWSYLPALTPWLLRFLGNANDADARRITQSLHDILGDSVEQHLELAGNTEAGRWLVPSDYLFAYRDRKAYNKDAYSWDLKSRYGFEPELIEGAAVQEREPALSTNTGLLAVVKQHGYVRSPGQYVKSLAAVFQGLGGSYLQTDARDFEFRDDRVTAIHTGNGTLPCNHVVLATGAWSKSLMQKLGLNIPLETERGYHVMFSNPSVSVTTPVMITDGKFVATPMQDGLRCAGVVELGGLEHGPSRAPIELLMRQVASTFPDLRYDEAIEWMGHRPTTPDCMPMIGEINHSGIYAAFGHQHVGLTGSAKTGRWIADLITGQPIDTDLAPFRPDRFARTAA